ncbi:MAG: helix-turn-helix transcriptional regulator [Bacillota bacterium]|nr:helix-turn-helix transcriptional regulator [Bacillota bacterium]
MSTNEKLKRYMDENGLKYSFVADKAGINVKKFSRIINGRTKLTVDDLEKICEKGLSVKPTIFLK